MLSRRKLLIGFGVVGAGTLAGLDQFTDVLEGESLHGGEDPPLTDPNGDNDDAFRTPWNADVSEFGGFTPQLMATVPPTVIYLPRKQ